MTTNALTDPKQGAANVAIVCGPTGYHVHAPFSPSEVFAEYPFRGEGTTNATNEIYETVRESLRLLELDGSRFGRPDWNPLGEVVRPGDTVMLKPNFVRDFRERFADDGDCLITHGSVIRAVLDYVFIALGGRGRIVIADAPQNDADFDGIRRIARLDEIQAFYQRHADFDVEVYDLRPERADKIDGVIIGHVPMPGDPEGNVKVNLAEHSAFVEVEDLCHLLYGSEYNSDELRSHHRNNAHEYLIARSVLLADVVISLPKLKTHKKTGLTVNMKNLVGINGNKNWLPHHREGTHAEGGDQFAQDSIKNRLERKTLEHFRQLFPLLGPARRVIAGPIKAVGKKVFGDTNQGTVRSGNWYGNDTTWRMVVDLNRILFYADADGVVHDQPVRRFFSLVDGIVGGEGNGPLDADPNPAGVIVAGRNPIAVDLACARLMGFDYRRLRVLTGALAPHPLPLVSFNYADVIGASNDHRFNCPIGEIRGSVFDFEPHFGWKGHIEVGEESHETCPVT